MDTKAGGNERGWSVICIEGYCLKDLDYIRRSEKFYCVFDDDEPDSEKWKEVPNEDYDPDAKVPDDPPYCEQHVCYTCLHYECPYFAFSDCRKENRDEIEWMGDELDDYVDIWSECKLDDYADVFYKMDKNLKDTLIETGENVGDYTYE